MENKDLQYTFIIGEEEARAGAVLPFLGVDAMAVEIPAGAVDGQRVPLTGNGKSYTVKLRICTAKYCLYQRILGAHFHDSLLIRHRDKKFLGFGVTMLLSLALLFGACTIGVEMLAIGFPMLALCLFLPNVWVRLKANRARAKVELEDRAIERQELLEVG